MSISKKEVEYVANLCRIKLDDSELNKFADQLSKILDYINKLKELDTKDVQPMAHVLDIKNILRKDVARASLKSEDALNCAPQKERNHFKVPKVVE